MKFILGLFGYAKVEHETWALAKWLRDRAIETNAEQSIVDGLSVLERWLRSCRGLRR